MKTFLITFDNLHEMGRGHDGYADLQMEVEAMTERSARRKFWDHWSGVYRYDVNPIALKKVEVKDPTSSGSFIAIKHIP
jgi:hypothetical protein